MCRSWDVVCHGICARGVTLQQKLRLRSKARINSLAFTLVEKEVDKFAFETVSG